MSSIIFLNLALTTTTILWISLVKCAATNLKAAVLSGFPLTTSTDFPGYDGTALCIADRTRLNYFNYPSADYPIKHCKCWMPMNQPEAPHFREDWIQVELFKPKLIKEVAVAGCTEFEK